jgi:hypothetical protein
LFPTPKGYFLSNHLRTFLEDNGRVWPEVALREKLLRIAQKIMYKKTPLDVPYVMNGNTTLGRNAEFQKNKTYFGSEN